MRIPTLLSLLTIAPALAAQDGAPTRPKLPRDADTNDARAYYEWGNGSDVSWANTADARYWASRLEPDNAAYFYGWWRALLRRQPVNWQADYWAGGATP